MADTVIKVENLGKQYHLGEVGTGTISHDFNRWWHRVRGKEDPYLKIGETNDRTKKGETDIVWALKNINFEVKQGDVLGIIGKNGAGKSTLLKILSRVTGPTIGEVKAKGRIASLLEVGTGFHPELTGRENVFLNGAILGMSKKEIKSKFDEIVDFSGVERYIDTPVKRYSSGMYVRLAFAVAAHLESEILIIDEVLAVGDAEFQKKCLGKMKDVSGLGRTVLFVSHNIDAVNSLCTKGIYLKNGEMSFNGTSSGAISAYLNDDKSSNDLNFFRIKTDSKKARITAIKLLATDNVCQFGENIVLNVTVNTNEKIDNSQIVIAVHNYLDNHVAVCYLNNNYVLESGRDNVFLIEIKSGYLITPGDYKLSVSLIQGDILEAYQNLDIIFGFPYFKITASQTIQNKDYKNIYKWPPEWANVLLSGEIKNII